MSVDEVNKCNSAATGNNTTATAAMLTSDTSDINMNEFFMSDFIDDNDIIGDLAEQVVQAAETVRGLTHYDLKGDEFSSPNHVDWGNYITLPSPTLHHHQHAAIISRRFFDLRGLCLSDVEKSHLHQAARSFLHHRRRHQTMAGYGDDDVNRATLIIKYCYSKYKEFNTVKKMNKAAVLIQSKFRSYQEQKRFQRSRHAAILIQSSYRNYKSTRKYLNNLSRSSGLAKKQQHQAARKIQRFLRRCRRR